MPVRLASRRDALRIFGAGGAAALLATLGASSAPARTPTAEVPGEVHQPATVTGSVRSGFVASLTVGV